MATATIEGPQTETIVEAQDALATLGARERALEAELRTVRLDELSRTVSNRKRTSEKIVRDLASNLDEIHSARSTLTSRIADRQGQALEQNRAELVKHQAALHAIVRQLQTKVGDWHAWLDGLQKDGHQPPGEWFPPSVVRELGNERGQQRWAAALGH